MIYIIVNLNCEVCVFLEFDEDDVVNSCKEKVLIIDGHNIAYMMVYSVITTSPEDNGVFELWKSSFYSKFLSMVFDINPTKVVLVFDSKASWRYGLYDAYKANRKKPQNNPKYQLDKPRFVEAIDNIINDIRSIFTNIYTIKVDTAEGDDIIAVLTKYRFNKGNYSVVVASTDRDLVQLMKQRGVRQYNPQKLEYIEVLSPETSLQMKILTGDKSDNIPPIRRGVGEKKAEKILLSSGGIEEFIKGLDESESEKVKDNYEMNMKLIDFDHIPLSLRDAILSDFDRYIVKPLDGKSVVKYFMDNGLMDMMTRWSQYSIVVKEVL